MPFFIYRAICAIEMPEVVPLVQYGLRAKVKEWKVSFAVFIMGDGASFFGTTGKPNKQV